MRFAKLSILFFLLALVSCRERILIDAGEYEANNVLTHLDAAGFDAQREKKGSGLWDITVPRGEIIEALKLLRERRIIRKPVQSRKTNTGFLISREQRHFEFERGLSEEIERTLLSLDGALDVRVHLNLPRRDPVLGKRVGGAQDTSASVLMIGSEVLSKVSREQIAKLVSGASGIDVSRVEVLISLAETNRVQQISPPLLDGLDKEEMPQGSEPEVPAVSSFRDVFGLRAIALEHGLAFVFFACGVFLLLRASFSSLRRSSKTPSPLSLGRKARAVS